MHEVETRSLNECGWRAYGAYIDPMDQIPGPGKSPLHRVGNKLHAYAWFQHRVPVTLAPGMAARMSLTIGEVSALKSALVFAGVPGRPELRVDWTTARPRTKVLMGAVDQLTVKGGAAALGPAFWRLSLSLINRTPRQIHLMPTFYVTRGVENAGLDLGLHAGDAEIEIVPAEDLDEAPSQAGRKALPNIQNPSTGAPP